MSLTLKWIIFAKNGLRHLGKRDMKYVCIRSLMALFASLLIVYLAMNFSLSHTLQHHHYKHHTVVGSKLKRKRTRRNLAFALKILPRFNSWQDVFTIATKAKVKIWFNSPNFYELWNANIRKKSSFYVQKFNFWKSFIIVNLDFWAKINDFW